jgi:hypothetical protein
MASSSLSSSQILILVFFSYEAPSKPVSLLKYLIVGHPPAIVSAECV